MQLLNDASIPVLVSGGAISYNYYRDSGRGQQLFARFQRKDVTEADYLGVQYLFKSGYDAQASVRFLQKLEAIEASEPVQGIATNQAHPPTADRIKAVQEAISILPQRTENIVTTSEFEAVKRRFATRGGRE